MAVEPDVTPLDPGCSQLATLALEIFRVNRVVLSHRSNLKGDRKRGLQPIVKTLHFVQLPFGKVRITRERPNVDKDNTLDTVRSAQAVGP